MQRFIQNIAKNVKTTRVTRIFAKVLIACRATTFGKVCDVKVIACAARTT